MISISASAEIRYITFALVQYLLWIVMNIKRAVWAPLFHIETMLEASRTDAQNDPERFAYFPFTYVRNVSDLF